MTLAWGIGAGGAPECGEYRGLFCFGGSFFEAPIHEEFVIRDVEGICFTERSARLVGRQVRSGSIE